MYPNTLKMYPKTIVNVSIILKNTFDSNSRQKKVRREQLKKCILYRPVWFIKIAAWKVIDLLRKSEKKCKKIPFVSFASGKFFQIIKELRALLDR